MLFAGSEILRMQDCKVFVIERNKSSLVKSGESQLLVVISFHHPLLQCACRVKAVLPQLLG